MLGNNAYGNNDNSDNAKVNSPAKGNTGVAMVMTIIIITSMFFLI